MKKLCVLGIVATLSTVCGVQADERKELSAAEITQLISGNTLSGVFGEEKTRYAQRNHSTGIAVVHADGTPVRLIPWFVKEPSSYCEDWAEAGVLCYQIAKDTSSGEHVFVRPDGTTSELNIQEGLHSITFE